MPLDDTQLRPTIALLDQIDRTIGFIDTPEKWCKQPLRTIDGRRCMLGAMMMANAEITLKEPIRLAIRQVTGRDYLRIEMFNDHPRTTHAMVLQALHQARANIIAGCPVPLRLLAPEEPQGFWALIARALRLRAFA